MSIFKNFSESLLKHIKSIRITFGCAILGVLILLCYLGAEKSSSFLTFFEAILGILSVWLTIEIYRIGSELSIQQNDVITKQSDLISEVHTTVMASARINHSQELRRKYDEAKLANDDFKIQYWHFIWRFETWTTMTLNLKPKGWARIRILGTNNPAFESDLEKLENPIYTVKITEVKDCDDLHTGLAYCWCFNGDTQISNSANEIELYSPVVSFTISGRVGNARAVATQPKNYKRMKDLENPSFNNKDQNN